MIQSPLHIENLSAGYGKTSVLHGIDLHVEAGEHIGLVGLNGVGKTTLIKVILGLRIPTDGSVTVMGGKNTDMEGKKQFAYLPEKFDPPSFLSGWEFIKFSQSLYKKTMDKDTVLAMADRLNLKRGALDKRVSTYSKGMRQKLGLMATLLTECPLLILDEPMSGLDPRARALVKDELAAYQKKDNTIFICSHILADLDEICDRIAVLNNGRLAFTGTPDALKKKTGKRNLERAFLACIDAEKAAA